MDTLTIRELLRNNAFREIIRIAARLESYARSLEEAAWRGDAVTVHAHLSQSRSCLIAMIQTYRDYLHGQNTDIAEAKSANGDRPDSRERDGDPRSRLERTSGLLPPGARLPATRLSEMGGERHDDRRENGA